MCRTPSRSADDFFHLLSSLDMTDESKVMGFLPFLCIRCERGKKEETPDRVLTVGRNHLREPIVLLQRVVANLHRMETNLNSNRMPVVSQSPVGT